MTEHVNQDKCTYLGPMQCCPLSLSGARRKELSSLEIIKIGGKEILAKPSNVGRRFARVVPSTSHLD